MYRGWDNITHPIKVRLFSKGGALRTFRISLVSVIVYRSNTACKRTVKQPICVDSKKDSAKGNPSQEKVNRIRYRSQFQSGSKTIENATIAPIRYGMITPNTIHKIPTDCTRGRGWLLDRTNVPPVNRIIF